MRLSRGLDILSKQTRFLSEKARSAKGKMFGNVCFTGIDKNTTHWMKSQTMRIILDIARKAQAKLDIKQKIPHMKQPSLMSLLVKDLLTFGVRISFLPFSNVNEDDMLIPTRLTLSSFFFRRRFLTKILTPRGDR